MIITENIVNFSRKTLDMIKINFYYNDLIDAIEDLESLEEEKKVATGFMEFREFDKLRKKIVEES